MAVGDRAAAVAPYIEQLLDDDALRANLRRAASASRDVYSRARGKDKAADAVQDKRVRRRAHEAALATRAAVRRISGAEQRERRRKRARRLALAAVSGGAIAIAAIPAARGSIGRALGGGEQQAGQPRGS